MIDLAKVGALLAEIQCGWSLAHQDWVTAAWALIAGVMLYRARTR